MAQRPTFPSPYLSGIDATVDNDFICLINDKDIITDFVFTITEYIETTENNKTITSFKEVYTYSKEETEPIYGGSGNNSYLIVTVPADEGVLNNVGTKKDGIIHTGKYKWKVKLTDNYGNIAESKEYYFKCIAKPKIEITSDSIVSGSLNSANAIFTGSYQCDSPLVYYRFILKKDNEIIKDTGEIYSQYISFEYDMFIQGNYSLLLQTENDGKMKSEETLNFTVDYTPASTNVAPECYVSSDENSVVVDFSEVMTIPGTYMPDTELYQQIDISDTLKGVYIPKNTELYWQQRVGVSDNLDIDENAFAVQLMVNLPYGKQGKIIEISGDNSISISFDGFRINYQYSSGTSGSTSIYKNDEYTSANILSTETIDNDKIYAFSFNASDEYNFTEEYKFALQNPMNMYWWLLTITPDGVTATKGAEVIV